MALTWRVCSRWHFYLILLIATIWYALVGSVPHPWSSGRRVTAASHRTQPPAHASVLDAGSRLSNLQPNTSKPHWRRLDDEEWHACYIRGCALTRLLASPQLPANKATQWTTYAQLSQNGWISSTQSRSSTKDAASLIQGAIAALRLPAADDSSWIHIEWTHSQASSDGKFHATGAVYEQLYNAAAGVIVAIHNESPEHVMAPPPASQLVPLRKWSDVVYLTWTHVCSTATPPADPKGLKYILRVNVVNWNSRDAVERVIGGDLETLTDWPGTSIDPSSEEGLALLGTPNGNGIGWLFLQHKSTLGGVREVRESRVWDPHERVRKMFGGGEGSVYPSMFFHVAVGAG